MSTPTVFQIKSGSSWHDYSSLVKLSGAGWSRNDLDADGSGRTLDGIMHRAKVDTKRTIAYQLLPADRGSYANLDTDLSQQTFEAKIADLHGETTKTFYCSSFTATLDLSDSDGEQWSGGSFTIIEV